MGEGKPLGTCASWTIAFGPVFAAAGWEPGAGPTEVPARLPLAFGSLCASLRFPVLKDLRNRALPSGQRQAVRLVRNLSDRGIRAANGANSASC